MLSSSAIARLRHQHETLVELLQGFSEEEQRRQVIPGKWSMFEQAAHLAAYQPTFYARLQRIEHENSPCFERYVADNGPHFHECCKNPLNSLYEAHHRFSIFMLAREMNISSKKA